MKTYKREIAVALLIWLAYVVEVKDANIVEVLVWPIFTFVALAFGLDWWNKSGNGVQQPTNEAPNRGRTIRSGQHPSSEDSHPDSR
jgi:hypothetical protein